MNARRALEARIQLMYHFWHNVPRLAAGNFSTTLETQIFNERNGNKIYFNDSKAQRINMVLEKLAGPFFGILYKILFGCGKSNEMKQTNKN